MKKILILVAIFLIGIFSSAVFAADWMQLDNQNYIKLEKVDSTNRLFYWVKILNKGDMRAIKNRKVSYKLSYMMSDCSNNTQSVLII